MKIKVKSNENILFDKLKKLKNQLKELHEKIITLMNNYKSHYKFLTIMKIIEKDIWEDIKISFRGIKHKIFKTIKNKKLIIKYYNNVSNYLLENDHEIFANDLKIIDQKIDSNNLEYYRLSIIYNDIIKKKKLKTHMVIDTSDINIKNKIKIINDNYIKIKEINEKNIVLNKNIKDIKCKISEKNC
jgi:hypothetical protein